MQLNAPVCLKIHFAAARILYRFISANLSSNTCAIVEFYTFLGLSMNSHAHAGGLMSFTKFETTKFLGLPDSQTNLRISILTVEELQLWTTPPSPTTPLSLRSLRASTQWWKAKYLLSVTSSFEK
jgi:hypothetical protein